jgi:hypothetical protein
VSLLDLAPTILDVAGIGIADRQDGINLRTGEAGRRRERLAPDANPILFEIWNHVLPNPAVGMVFAGSDGLLYTFVYNAADDQDELYRLGGHDEVFNRIDELPDIRKQAVHTLAEALTTDPRWFGYAQYFNLEYAEKLPRGRGDAQLFKGRDTLQNALREKP